MYTWCNTFALEFFDGNHRPALWNHRSASLCLWREKGEKKRLRLLTGKSVRTTEDRFMACCTHTSHYIERVSYRYITTCHVCSSVYSKICTFDQLFLTWARDSWRWFSYLQGWLPTVNRIVSEEGAGALLKGIGPRSIVSSLRIHFAPWMYLCVSDNEAL